MKRSPLIRRTELASGNRRLSRKTRLRSQPSKKKARERRQAQPAVDAVFERDRACVLRGRHECFGPLDPHHLIKSGQGGPWTVDNLVVLCRAANGWVEDNPSEAHALGLVVRNGESVYDAWTRMVRAGLPVVHPILDPHCEQYDCSICGGAP